MLRASGAAAFRQVRPKAKPGQKSIQKSSRAPAAKTSTAPISNKSSSIASFIPGHYTGSSAPRSVGNRTEAWGGSIVRSGT
jgi:hypothetical protein